MLNQEEIKKHFTVFLFLVSIFIAIGMSIPGDTFAEFRINLPSFKDSTPNELGPPSITFANPPYGARDTWYDGKTRSYWWYNNGRWAGWFEKADRGYVSWEIRANGRIGSDWVESNPAKQLEDGRIMIGGYIEDFNGQRTGTWHAYLAAQAGASVGSSQAASSISIAGTYALYQKGNESRGPVGYMRISGQHGNNVSIGGASPSGQPTNDWRGTGTIQGTAGYYSWRFNDGRTGRTNFTVDNAGNLHGQVRGSGISWDYIARKTSRSSDCPPGTIPGTKLGTWGQEEGCVPVEQGDGGHSSQQQRGIDGSYSSTFGTLTLRTQGSKVSGTFTSGNGTISGIFASNVLEGIWVQTTSGQRCSSARNGGYYWGRVRFVFDAPGRFTGKWGYCDNAPSRGWSGNRR